MASSWHQKKAKLASAQALRDEEEAQLNGETRQKRKKERGKEIHEEHKFVVPEMKGKGEKDK